MKRSIHIGTYETIVTAVLLVLCAALLWRGIKAYVQAAKEQDDEPRKACRQKALVLTALALMNLLCALYIILRIWWLMLIVLLIGTAAAAYAIGSGIGANMREH